MTERKFNKNLPHVYIVGDLGSGKTSPAIIMHKTLRDLVGVFLQESTDLELDEKAGCDEVESFFDFSNCKS